MEEPKVHGFNKTFSAKTCSQTLEIPRWYVKYSKMKAPDDQKAWLIGRSGSVWSVDLVSIDGKLYFQQGWLEFQKCNNLTDLDLLVFKYDGKVTFNVKIYKEKITDSEPSQHHHLKQETAEQGGSESCDDVQDRLSLVMIMKHYNVRHDHLQFFPAGFVKEHFSGHGEKVELVLENATGREWPITLAFKSHNVYRGWSQFVRDNEIEEGDTCRFEVVGKLTMRVHISPNKTSSHLKQGKDTDDTQLFTRAGKKPKHADEIEGNREQNRATDSDRRSFVKEIKIYNVNRPFSFKIPSWFVRQHFSGYGENVQVVLENERGKRWTVNLVLKLQTICGEWTKFVRDNEIKQGDTYTFELTSTLTMRVHISSSKPSSQLQCKKFEHAHVVGDQDRAFEAQKPSNQEGQGERSAAEDLRSFTIHMKPYNARIFNVGSEFMASHCSSYGKAEKIVLENEKGKHWSVNLSRQRKGGLMAGGVSAFVRDNNIKERDTCTFTLAGERKMLVHISRHSQVEKDSGSVKVEQRTYDTRGKRPSSNKRKRKRSGEEDGRVEGATVAEEIAELREGNRRIMQMLHQMNKSNPC